MVFGDGQLIGGIRYAAEALTWPVACATVSPLPFPARSSARQSTIASQPPTIADEVRGQADVFTDLLELRSKLGRDPSERPAPRDREPRASAEFHTRFQGE